MRKIVLVLSVVLFVLVAGGQALAEDKPKLDASDARWSLLKKTGGFVGGLTAGLLCHEAGHQVVASLEGVSMDWNLGGGIQIGKWTAHNYSSHSLRNIALGGFGAQVLSTEILLGFDEIPKDNSFILGWMTFNILNSIFYVLVNELSSGHEDLKTLRDAGMGRNDVTLLEVGLVAHALLSAYRVYKDPKFIPYVRATKSEFAVGISWQW